MGYRELLQALEEEVGRQIRERRAETAQEEQRILETTHAEVRARREDVLEKERRRLADESARSLSTARLEQARALLGEMRRQMAELLSAAEAQLAAMNDRGLLARLVDEVVPELGEGPLVFRVKQGYERHLESHLRQNHPALLPRSTIEGSPEVRGGVEISLGGRQRLDNTLHSRLQNAWRLLEPEIGALLFQQAPALPQPSGPARDESVAAVSLVGKGDGEL